MVSLWEFLHVSEGITLSREQRRTRRSWLDDHGILVLDIGKNTSQSFRVLAELDQTPHGVADCLIAAECIARGFPLVTYNVRHFAVLENLHLVPLAPLR